MASTAVELRKIVDFLNETLLVDSFSRDPSNNGLQVQGASKGVTKICCGVDASPEFFAAAKERGAELVIAHHGISWGNSLARISGLNYDRVAPLILSDMALYAVHLPLDAHPVYGNNAQLAKALGLVDVEPFGVYAGYPIGVKGRFCEPVKWTAFLEMVQAVCPDGDFRHLDFGKDTIESLGIVSGGGGGELEQAVEQGLDAFLTGEVGLVEYNSAKLAGVNYAAAGHYATERFGVKAITELVASRFSLDWEFIDFKLSF